VKRQRATDATAKAEALRLAEEHGAAEAAKLTGVPASTIRSWRHRSGESGPPKSVDPRTWAERKRAGAEDAWAAAQEALAQVRSLLVAGRTADGQRAALTMAILTDKSGVLEEAACREEERQVRIAEGQAQFLVAVIRVYFGAVGLTLGPAARQTLAQLLRQATDGGALSPPAEAPAATSSIPARRSGRQLAPSAGSRSGWQDLGKVTHRPILPKGRRRLLRNGPRLNVEQLGDLLGP
jgi:transposase-like protein